MSSNVRRSLWFRSVAILWAPWFAFALSRPVPVDPCPMHGSMGAMAGTSAVGDMPGMGASAAGQVAASASVADKNGAVAPAAPASNDDGGHSCCPCIGQRCCCSQAVATRGQSVVFGAGVAPRFALPAPVAVVGAAVRQPHAQPFAIGPPALA